MKSFFKTFAPVLLTLVLLCVPLVSLAITTPVVGSCPGNAGCLENPLQVSSFCDLLKIVLQALIIIGLPVAVVFLVLVGFQFILARGSDTGLSKAKSNLLHTVIGIAIFLGAWTIAEIIKSTLEALGVSGFGSC